MHGNGMRGINTTDFKNDLDEWLSLIEEGPIVLTRSGKEVAVLISMPEFELVQRIKKSAAASSD